jgi:hypothetical protein
MKKDKKRIQTETQHDERGSKIISSRMKTANEFVSRKNRPKNTDSKRRKERKENIIGLYFGLFFWIYI